MYEAAISLLNEIEQKGYTAYIIGGYPRDKYLGRKTTDIDIATSMTKDVIEETFEIISSYKELGSFKIKYKDYIFEITTFRIEEEYLDKRRPSKIRYTKSFTEDLKRRDFTINALAIDKKGEYIDVLNAKKDLDNKIIRVIGNIEKKINEDPLRIIRAIRFKIELNFKLDKDLEEYILNNKKLIEYVSDYHIKKEYDKLAEKNKLEFKKELEKLTNRDILV